MFRIARGGANWVITPIVVAILMAGLAGPLGRPWLIPASTIPFFLATSLLWFFRDPERPLAPDVVSPADGKVRAVDIVDDPDLGRCDRLSIFMSPLDVHVNRMPVSGNIRKVTHRPGGHVPAFSKESDRNERVETLMVAADNEVLPAGTDVKVVQIAGTVARRIVPYIEAGQSLARGQRFGLIRLSSRCDLLVPVGNVAWTVAVGDRVRAASSRVAASPGNQAENK